VNGRKDWFDSRGDGRGLVPSDGMLVVRARRWGFRGQVVGNRTVVKSGAVCCVQKRWRFCTPRDGVRVYQRGVLAVVLEGCG